MKLSLGTAQFGQQYGIANKTGRLSEKDVQEIIEFAHRIGIKFIDTAYMYGEAEVILGRNLPARHNFSIVTKTPKFHDIHESRVASLLLNAFAKSCIRLKTDHVYGLLIHDANDLLGPCGDVLWDAMNLLKSEGKVNRIGVSIYCAEQIDKLLCRYSLELVQLPLSLLDQRLIKSGHIERLANTGVEIHARSPLLQGAMVMPIGTLPSRLSGISAYIKKIEQHAGELGITKIEAALRFVANHPGVATVVCGVDSINHIKELAQALVSLSPTLGANDAAECACADQTLVDPSKWNLK